MADWRRARRSRPASGVVRGGHGSARFLPAMCPGTACQRSLPPLGIRRQRTTRPSAGGGRRWVPSSGVTGVARGRVAAQTARPPSSAASVRYRWMIGIELAATAVPNAASSVVDELAEHTRHSRARRSMVCAPYDSHVAKLLDEACWHAGQPRPGIAPGTAVTSRRGSRWREQRPSSARRIKHALSSRCGPPPSPDAGGRRGCRRRGIARRRGITHGSRGRRGKNQHYMRMLTIGAISGKWGEV